MSGQRNKKPSDIVMRRQEYLDNLAMEIENQNLIEQAVNLYKTTQQVMPISQIKDNRTASEKIMDIEKLKINLIKDLEPLANPQLASAMVQGLIQSPLNADNRLLIFAAQSAPELVEKLKKLYKYGIRGDSNDIEQFVSYINKYYSERRNLSDISKKFFQQQGIAQGNVLQGENKMKNIRDKTISFFTRIKLVLTSLMKVKEEVQRASSKKISRVELTPIKNKSNEIMENIKKYKELIIDTPGGLEKLIYEISNMPQSIDTINASEALETYLFYFNNITPNFDQLDTLIKEIDRSINILRKNLTTGNFTTEINKISIILDNINDLIVIPDNDYKTISNALDILSDVNQISYKKGVVEPVDEEDEDYEESKGVVAESDTKTSDGTYRFRREKPVPIPQPISPLTLTEREQLIKEVIDLNNQLEDSTLPEEESQPIIDEISRLLHQLFGSEYDQRALTFDDISFLERKIDDNKKTLIKLQKKIKPGHIVGQYILGRYKTMIDKDIEKLNSLKSKKTSGRGIRMRGKGINNVDLDQGIEAAPRYIKFGKYLINKKKLNDNVLSLRRDKGSMVAKLPAYKMTSNLSNVFKTIVGGGTPTYEQLNQLTEDEKQYLHKVANESDIYDKIKIPTPSKDQEEKDIHSFNVMKGEIMAGNNSKELVHKFKILLLKLSKQNILPKNQVNEVMEDLLEMGY